MTQKVRSIVVEEHWFKLICVYLGVAVLLIMGWCSTIRIIYLLSPISYYELGVQGPDLPPRASGTVRVGTYNIAHGRGGKTHASKWNYKSHDEHKAHLEKLARHIIDADLDIIVLNEVDFRSFWNYDINQAEYLMYKAGFKYRLEQTNMVLSLPFYYFHFGNAILSRYPIKAVKHIGFPALFDLENIYAGDQDGMFVTFASPRGPLAVAVVHLEYRGEGVRVESVKILDEMARNAGVPVLLMGDFNSTPLETPGHALDATGANAIQYLISGGRYVPALSMMAGQEVNTYPSEMPDRKIDWIFGRGIKRFISARTIPSDLSDHSMVVAEVEL